MDNITWVGGQGNVEVNEIYLTSCLASLWIMVEGNLKHLFMVLFLLSITFFSGNSIAPFNKDEMR